MSKLILLMQKWYGVTPLTKESNQPIHSAESEFDKQFLWRMFFFWFGWFHVAYYHIIKQPSVSIKQQTRYQSTNFCLFGLSSSPDPRRPRFPNSFLLTGTKHISDNMMHNALNKMETSLKTLGGNGGMFRSSSYH